MCVGGGGAGGLKFVLKDRWVHEMAKKGLVSAASSQNGFESALILSKTTTKKKKQQRF